MRKVNDSVLEISVVIPTYNRAVLLERAIRSVLAQTRAVEEIIVVDDGSNDSTKKVIESLYNDRVNYIYQPNRGVSHARNIGIKNSTGNWVALLDSDDEWHPNKLEIQIEALRNQPEYNFCHTNEIWIRNGKRVNAMQKHEKSGGFIFEKCLPLCVISPSSVLMRKTIVDEIGLFDEDLPACEDYDYWLRYCCCNPVLYIETPLLTKYGGHDDQLSKKYLGMDRFRLRALLKAMSLTCLSSSQSNSIRHMFFEKYKILESGAKKHDNVELLNYCEALMLEMESLLAQKNDKN